MSGRLLKEMPQDRKGLWQWLEDNFRVNTSLYAAHIPHIKQDIVNHVMDLLYDKKKAQDIKTAAAVNAGWVEWGHQLCPHLYNNYMVEKRCCSICFEERKRSVGL